MKFSICNEIFRDWDLKRIFQTARRIGYDAVEIAPFTLADSVVEISERERARIKSLAAAEGVELSAIHWVLVKPDGLYINHPDEAVRQKTSDYFVELVDFCADIGARSVVVGSPKQRCVKEEVTFENARAWALETFSAAVKRAEERKVSLCMEPLGAAETNFINTAQEAIAFTQELASPAFKIILDVKAMSSEGRPLPEIIYESRGHFTHFHANDPNLKGPGFGDTDFVPILRALKEVGYDGYVSVEVFKFDEGPELIASRSLETLQAAWRQVQSETERDGEANE
ncbi:MAG: sugar phosphate isomerase/epimerase family protein [Limisphaerales bacterium]|jgi:sugar phosphate isomerase/epimerase|nr:sugar phosphate isomerase/epimerase family protein [Verrucomicrobiota bacterium]